MPNLGGRTVVQVACGALHTCLLLDDGTIRIFGDDSDGQLNVTMLNDFRVTAI